MSQIMSAEEHEQILEGSTFSLITGLCPVDGGSLEFIVFDERVSGLGLLPESFPYMTRLCSRCLVASNKREFFIQDSQPLPAAVTETVIDDEAIKKAQIKLLPARLVAVKKALAGIAKSELTLLVEDRRPILEQCLRNLVRKGLPKPSADTVATLVQHGVHLLTLRPGLDELAGKLVKHAGFASRFARNTPLGALLAEGAEPSAATQAGVYGALISAFDAEGLACLAEPPASRQETALALACLHQELVRLTLYARQYVVNPALRQQINETGCLEDPERLVCVVESHMQANVSKRNQDGYDCLNLGLSYYRGAMARWCLLNLREAPVEERLRELTPEIWKAIMFFELSLLSEQYPRFMKSDKITGLHTRGRIKVPFFLGEFGIRHILCFLYNELGKMRLEAGEEPEKGVIDLVGEIKEHWLAVHEQFCQIEFGGPRDPLPVQLLIPRLIAFATACYHKDTSDMLKQTVLDNRTRLYGRYMAEGLALASSLI